MNPIQWLIGEKETPKTSDLAGVGIVARNSFVFSGIDDEPQDEELQFRYLEVYNKFGIVARAVDATTEQAVQTFFFDGPNSEKLDMMRKTLNLDNHFFRVCKTMLKHGSCFVEVVKEGDKIVKVKLLPPEQMVVVREMTGRVIAYVQRTSSKSLVWGLIQPGNAVYGNNPVVVGAKEDIIHYMFNRQAGEKYGTALVRPALRMLRIREQIENQLPVLMQRYIAPLIHFKVGDEDHPPSAGDIANIKSKTKNIYADSELVTHYAINAEVLGFKDKSVMNIQEIFTVIDSDILRAMGMFPILTGGIDKGDKASEVQLRAESRHIKAIQRELKTEFEDKFIIGQDIGGVDDLLVWGIPDEREELEHINNVIAVFNAGLLTRQRANELLPRKFHEQDLPQGDSLAVGAEPAPQLPNPNDPTQSTQMKEGRRVKRDDVRNPLDKQVTKTANAQHDERKKE